MNDIKKTGIMSATDEQLNKWVAREIMGIVDISSGNRWRRFHPMWKYWRPKTKLMYSVIPSYTSCDSDKRELLGEICRRGLRYQFVHELADIVDPKHLIPKPDWEFCWLLIAASQRQIVQAALLAVLACQSMEGNPCPALPGRSTSPSWRWRSCWSPG